MTLTVKGMRVMGRNDNEVTRDFGGCTEHFLMHFKSNFAYYGKVIQPSLKMNINFPLETFPP